MNQEELILTSILLDNAAIPEHVYKLLVFTTAVAPEHVCKLLIFESIKTMLDNV